MQHTVHPICVKIEKLICASQERYLRDGTFVGGRLVGERIFILSPPEFSTVITQPQTLEI